MIFLPFSRMATSWEAQVGTDRCSLWVRVLYPRFWKSNGTKRIVRMSLVDETELTTPESDFLRHLAEGIYPGWYRMVDSELYRDPQSFLVSDKLVNAGYVKEKILKAGGFKRDLHVRLTRAGRRKARCL